MLLRVESLWAALELDEIVHELRDFVTCVGWDADAYLFSLVATFHDQARFVLPDRSDMTANTHCLRSLAAQVATVGARRGLEVIGDVPQAVERIEAADLLLVPRGRITANGMRERIATALDYLRQGPGEPAGEADLARRWAAELARAQLWQCVQHETGVLDEGRTITPALFLALLEEVLAERGKDTGIEAAAGRLTAVVLNPDFVPQL